MTTTTTTPAMIPSKNSFDRFGDDLAEILLQYLPTDDKLRLESVSKQWQSLIFNGQTDLVFDGKLFMNLNLNNSLIDEKQTISLLFELLAKKCPNITSVNISSIRYLINYFDLLLKYCHQLKHLFISHVCLNSHDWISYSQSFDCFCRLFGQQLQTFKFNVKCIETNEHLFYKSINSLTNLKTVDIIINWKTRLDIILANYGQQIKQLNLSLDDELEDDSNNFKTLRDCLSQMQQLKQLAISLPVDFGTDQTVQLLTTIGRRCRQLLEFSYSSNETSIDLIIQIFVTITEHISPKLRRLSLNCWPISGEESNYDEELVVITSGSLKRFYRLTHLTLRVGYWGIIGDQFFRDIHCNLPRLQYIRCFESSITDESIQAMVQLVHLMDIYLLCDPNKLMTTEIISIISNQLLIDSNIKHLFIEYWLSKQMQKDFVCGKYDI